MADRMDSVTRKPVRPTQGRHTIELISGHTADGSIALADVVVTIPAALSVGDTPSTHTVTLRGEAIVLVTEMDPRDPDAEISVQPLALVLDDRWYDKVRIVYGDDEADDA